MLTEALLVLLALPAAAADSADEVIWKDKQSDWAAAEARNVEKIAKREAAALGRSHAWAGSYYWGDGLGANVSLTLAPHAGFVFEWQGCVGIYDRNFGAVAVDGDSIRLLPKLANTHKGFEGVDEELIPVLWGERHYLVASDKIKDFCNAVNSGTEPRSVVHGFFLLRDGDEKRVATGRPNLPSDLGSCLLGKPIRARIAGAGASKTAAFGEELIKTITPVTLGAGRSEGVFEGMELHLERPGRHFVEITVSRIDEHTSEAAIEEITLKGRDEPWVPLVGRWVTTQGR